MIEIFSLLPELFSKTIMAVIQSLSHNWIPLSLAILTAAILKAHVDTERLQETLHRRTKISILASVILGAFTPFCACGTMAVIIGMLTTALPWGPVMAFLTSSPLMSPDGFIMIAGIISFKFAVALTLASIVIGLGSGYLTHLIEMKTDFLKKQTRFSNEKGIQIASCGGCRGDYPLEFGGCCTRASNKEEDKKKAISLFANFWQRIKWREILQSIINLGLKQILPNFALFVAIGFLVNYFVPTSIIMRLFNAKNIFAVPLAALIGLPLYVTTESSIPLTNSLMAGGASGGAMLGFIITGSATSAWVIAGISTFMKKKVIGLYILHILLGGIICGYLFDLFLAIKL